MTAAGSAGPAAVARPGANDAVAATSTAAQARSTPGPRGSRRAATSATVATHLVPSAQGNITTRPSSAGPDAASRPAGRPSSITAPATGTASRLAGTDTAGRRWNTSRLGR